MRLVERVRLGVVRLEILRGVLDAEKAGHAGFFCIQDPAEYFQTHHTQADTFDQAHEADLVEGAQVMAAVAYNIAQLPELLPRKPAPPAASGSPEE